MLPYNKLVDANVMHIRLGTEHPNPKVKGTRNADDDDEDEHKATLSEA